MTLFDLLQFAGRALGGHRLRSALSVLGVVIGVTSVVLLTALGEGARIYVVGELAALGSDLLIVLPGKVETAGAMPFVGGVPHDLTLADAHALQLRIPRIRKLAPVTIGQTTASFGALNREISVIGTTADFEPLRHIAVSEGVFLPPAEMDRGSPVCVLGSTVRRELFRGTNPLGKILRIGDWRFRIIGVLEPRGQSMGFNLDDLVMVPVATAMKLFDQTTLFRVMIGAKSYEDLDRIKRDVTQIIKERHNNEDDITLITQDSMLTSFNRIFTALTLALAGIAAISLTVAGIGIMNVMLVSVSERTSEIGLLKAVGVTSRQIVGVFLAEASLLCVLGGFVGLIIARLLIALSNELFPALPAQAPPWSMPAAMVVALFVGIAFGVWPARRAAKLDPILALSKR